MFWSKAHNELFKISIICGVFIRKTSIFKIHHNVHINSFRTLCNTMDGGAPRVFQGWKNRAVGIVTDEELPVAVWYMDSESSRHFRVGSNAIFTSVFVFPLILPIASVVLFFQIIFAGDGVVNQILAAMGFSVTNWLYSDSAFTVLVILYIWKNCGYNIILFLAALNSIPREYYEVFSLESKSVFKRLRYVTIPLMSQYVFFILCISVINTFKSFREAFILCGDYPHTSIYMIQHFMSNNIRNLNYPRLSVAAVIVFLVIIMLIVLFFRFRTHAGERNDWNLISSNRKYLW